MPPRKVSRSDATDRTPRRRARRAELTSAVGLDDAQVHQLLRHGTVADCKPLPWGSNYTFAMLLEREGVGSGLAIYKPRRGESPLWDFPGGTLYRREYAAYVFSQHIGWPFVPPTVVRDGPYGIGSVQLYIEPDTDGDYSLFADRFPAQLMRFALFDAITNNADRKAGHCLLDSQGKLWGIDHGLTFNEDPKLRTVIWEFRGDPIPATILDELCAFSSDTIRRQRAARHLGAWLSPPEVHFTFVRLDQIIAARAFPMPDAYSRNMPWPPF